MKFSEFLHEAEASRWPLWDEASKVERAIKRKKFDDQRERALKKALEAEIDFSKSSDKAEAKKYAKLAKEVIKKIENREGEYRFAFKISYEEQEKRYKRIWATYKNRFSEKELEDIQYDAMMNVYHSLHSPDIGEFDIMETDDEEVWKIYEAGFESIILDKDAEAERKKETKKD